MKSKFVLIGDGATGKSTLCHRLVHGEPPGEYIPTVFENSEKAFTLSSGDALTVSLWDTSSQDEDRVRLLANADVVAVCFSCCHEGSFQSVGKKWVSEARHHLPDTPLVLLSLKADLRTDDATLSKLTEHGRRFIDRAEAAAFANKHGLEFVELSSHTGDGIEELLQRLFELTQGRRNARAAKRKVNKACVML